MANPLRASKALSRCLYASTGRTQVTYGANSSTLASCRAYATKTDTTDTKTRKRTAKAKAKDVVPSTPSLLEESKVQTYLAEIEATQHNLSLSDVERLRPAVIPSASSSSYEEQHATLIESLSKAFTVSQLRTILLLYGVKPVPKGRKVDYATQIVENQWGWPAWSSIKAQQRNKQKDRREFSISSKEAAVLLGIDYSGLRALSNSYSLHLSMTEAPRCLIAEGTLGSIDKLSEHLRNFRLDLATETVTLPLNRCLSQEHAQQISQACGLYIEPHDSGKVSIHFRRSEASQVQAAKRLATSAVFQTKKSSATPLIQLPKSVTDSFIDFPSSHGDLQDYSLYPFYSAGPLSGSSQERMGFRLRKTGRWLSMSSDPVSANSHTPKQYVTSSLLDCDLDLRRLLIERCKSFPSSKSIRVEARTGHLTVSPLANDPFTLSPPLERPLGTAVLLQWMKDHDSQIRFQSSCAGYIKHLTTVRGRLLRRLIYCPTVAGKTYLNGSQYITVELPFEAGTFAADAHSACIEHVTEESAWLMVPDRVSDLKYTAKSIEPLETPPLDIARMAQRISEPNCEIPLSFEHGGRTYVLQRNLQIWQTLKATPQGSRGWLADGNAHQLLVENIEDLDSGKFESVSMVAEDNVLSSESWDKYFNKSQMLTETSEPQQALKPHSDIDILKLLQMT